MVVLTVRMHCERKEIVVGLDEFVMAAFFFVCVKEMSCEFAKENVWSWEAGSVPRRREKMCG